MRVTYRQENDGTRASNTVTVTNVLDEPYPNGRVTIVVPAGQYRVQDGRRESHIASDDGRFHIMTIRTDIPADGSTTISVAPAK